MRILVAFSVALLRSLLALLRSREEQTIVELALLNSSRRMPRNGPGRSCHRSTEHFGLRSRDSGHTGRTTSWSSAPRPWCDGIAKDFAGTGDPSRRQVPAVPRSRRKRRSPSPDWTNQGVRLNLERSEQSSWIDLREAGHSLAGREVRPHGSCVQVLRFEVGIHAWRQAPAGRPR